MRLLDLFCCEGGASTGYRAAGFDVVGVDLEEQPLYPFAFHRGDWMAGLKRFGSEVDAVHASPPCQGYTTMSNRYRGKGGKADEHFRLIGEVRDALNDLGVPYVIENVPGARPSMLNPIVLSGGMFGLRVDRARLFESNMLLMPPPRAKVTDPVGVYGREPDGRRLFTRADGTEQRAARSVEEAREAMGMPWASWRGCAEAIPPAYTEFIGGQLAAHIRTATP